MAKLVLVAEDEAPLRKALVSKLEHEKYDVRSSSNGEDALEVALKEHPDMIVLDVLMPRLDGLEFLERLRNDEWGKEAKVILLSNLSDGEKIAAAITHGVTHYFVKSNIKIEDLVDKINELV